VASLAEEVRVASEELRADYRRAIDELEYLRTNNREAGRNLIDLRVENSELAIRNRELVEYAGKLERDLIAAGVDIERVAEEIGAWVPVE
jgi:AAA+ ATPase superfamily predicted ATPase